MIAYRQATQADAPAVLALLHEIMEHHGFDPPERKRLASIISSIIAAPGHCFLLAEVDPTGTAVGGTDAGGTVVDADSEGRRVVGLCALVFTISSWSAASVCEVQDVIVTEDYRREAVGGGLLRAAEDIARERGCVRLFLLAESWNLGAHAFYRSLGLQEKTCLYFERDLSRSATD